MELSKRVAIGIVCLGFIYPLFAQTTGKLGFTCTTAAPSGNWGNKHVVAIWVQNNKEPSVFIKTNAKYGHEDDHLTLWTSGSGKNLVDAVSGATLSSYGTLSIEWDGTDVTHNVVMDGNYSINIEMAWGKDKIMEHATSMFSFTKGPSAQQLTPAGNSNFSDIILNWQPATTLVSSFENKNGICIFPNPSNGAIKLNFQKELLNGKLEVADFSGKIVYSEKQKQIAPGTKTLNLSGMPTGMYLLSIYSEGSYFTYKLFIK